MRCDMKYEEFEKFMEDLPNETRIDVALLIITESIEKINKKIENIESKLKKYEPKKDI